MIPRAIPVRAIFTLASITIFAIGLAAIIRGGEPPRSAPKPRDFHFDGTMSREVLENYLSRSISMEGLLNGRGDLDDNIRWSEPATWQAQAGRDLGLGIRRDHLVCAPEPRISKRLAALRLGLGAADGSQRPSPDARQPHDAVAARRQALVLRQQAWPGRPGRIGRRGRDSRDPGGGFECALT
jgi:hypothetical protein